MRYGFGVVGIMKHSLMRYDFGGVGKEHSLMRYGFSVVGNAA
jgi:hypothetical protein